MVDTDMQATIRRCPPERFPRVERFRQLERAGAFNSPEHVARHLLGLAFGPDRGQAGYRVRVPDEHAG